VGGRGSPSLNVGDSTINYVVTKGSSRRYTYFRFRRDMTLEVVVPRRGRVDPEKAISAKLGWISAELERMKAVRAILRDDKVMFGGSYLAIAFEIDRNEMLIPDLVNCRLVVRATESWRTRELIRRWFIKESSTYVVQRVSEFARIMGARPSSVDVREIGKWGYCTRTGRLSFSWQLIALPDRLREYVVWHELTHLRVFDHSGDFRNALSRVCPDYKQRERELSHILPYKLPVG
jgi:predicted metal-dependent hydrolase